MWKAIIIAETIFAMSISLATIFIPTIFKRIENKRN